MRAISAIYGGAAKLAGRLAGLGRRPDFVCADCERWARCGLPASDDCIIRAAQIARGDWELRRRARWLSLIMGRPMPPH